MLDNIMFGNIVLDLLLVILLAIGVYYGWHRGFLRIVMKTFAGLFSAVFAMSTFEQLAAVLKENYVFPFIRAKMDNALQGMDASQSAQTLTDAVPPALQNAAKTVGIDLYGIAENAVKSGQDAVTEFAESASHSVAQMLSSAVAFALLFLAAFFVLRVLSVPISAIVMRVPIIGQINRALGLLFGTLTALVLAFIFSKLMGFLDETLNIAFIEVKDAWISGFLYRYSIFS